MAFNRGAVLSLVEGDKELLRSLLDLFKEDWPSLIKGLEVAIKEGRTGDVERIGHRLKGNLRNFYADDSAKLANEIEQAGQEGNLEQIKDKIDRLRPQMVELQKELEEFYKSLD